MSAVSPVAAGDSWTWPPHAHAHRTHVHVSERDGITDSRISDEGHGFEPSPSHDGFGLIGMRERVALHGGTITITSQPADGATVHARLSVRRRGPRPTRRQLARHQRIGGDASH